MMTEGKPKFAHETAPASAYKLTWDQTPNDTYTVLVTEASCL